MRYPIQIGLVALAHWLVLLPCCAQQQHATWSEADTPGARSRFVPASGRPNYLTDVTLWNWEEVDGGIGVSIRMAEGSITWGQPAVVMIAVRNASPTPRVIAETRPAAMFTVTITDEHGQSIPQTRWGSFVAAMGGGHGVLLHSGDALGYVMALDVLYDVTMPGRYTIQVGKKSVSTDMTGEEEVWSNRVSFEMRQRVPPDIDELLRDDAGDAAVELVESGSSLDRAESSSRKEEVVDR